MAFTAGLQRSLLPSHALASKASELKSSTQLKWEPQYEYRYLVDCAGFSGFSSDSLCDFE